jgi:hypothetical protein
MIMYLRTFSDEKTAILKAVAEKLIPGIPIQTRISILQQTASDGSDPVPEATSSLQKLELGSGNQFSVLEEVIDRATSRNEIQREIDGKITCRPKRVLFGLALTSSSPSKGNREPRICPCTFESV